ncbi:PREDICTED: 5'-nucleotidase domain-containing protein 3-like [Priapulus caudatus]|uniref:5'-nucleotidase domain-containing protein 3-like n=1 Tax=Priapulus caudatus TaxID=37621 RepID=A0ABM1EMY4_PRICU|nr:PREDICTED: 5'-nucleotidase domain-containing protein 3-like [Priapulus caudatus]
MAKWPPQTNDVHDNPISLQLHFPVCHGLFEAYLQATTFMSLEVQLLYFQKWDEVCLQEVSNHRLKYLRLVDLAVFRIIAYDLDFPIALLPNHMQPATHKDHIGFFMVKQFEFSCSSNRIAPVPFMRLNGAIMIMVKYHVHIVIPGLPPTPDIDPKAVFCNNELSLRDIEVYGFDYDYTLAIYGQSLLFLVYRLATHVLIDKYKYPNEISKLTYDPSFAVRGLHYDVHKGLLMKLDAFHKVQMGTVYHGHCRVPDNEVNRLYEGLHIPIDDLNNFYGYGAHFQQLVDIFSLPEIALLSDVAQHFMQHDIEFDADYLFTDVKTAVEFVHTSGLMHQEVLKDMNKYVEKDDGLKQMLRRLKDAGKSIFLVTNSGYAYVSKGMQYLLGDNWREMFDIIITKADKPKFFKETSRPFRYYDVQNRARTWNFVTKLEKGNIYSEGNIDHFKRMTGWVGSKVLYFGDHVYSDLADPAIRHGWRTGAIIPELEHEIKVINSTPYKSNLVWLQALQTLIANMQDFQEDDPEAQRVVHAWKAERYQLRNSLKEMFNPRFGSIFRTHTNPTYFSRRLARFADIYTSSVTNLMHYTTKHTYYPQRAALPHELDPGAAFYNVDATLTETLSSLSVQTPSGLAAFS